MRVLALACLLFAPVAAETLNPVTRVVQLMEGLSKKTEQDGKAEEDLFQQYVCWYKTVVSSKKASNAEASDRIESLTAYIDDVKSGRVEFTSERKDLEAEIEKLNTEIETATDMRNKENEDFLAAKDEMEKAIAALEKAIEVLGDATADHKEGVLVSVGFDLRRAAEMGKNFLSEQDARFLEQVLDGQVPKADWKKLNRKATFKMKYKARSTKIQEILADMLQTFEDNLAEATKTEKDAKSTFDTLMGAKNSQLSAAQDALSGGEGEGAARTLAADEAQEEVDALTTQVSNDEKYISQVEASYADKVDEWKERKRLRTEEIASISKAIEILASDDAKDLMSSSFKSQGNFFLQESNAGCSQMKRATKVMHKLRAMAAKHRDPRLSSLAVAIQLNARGHFDKIVEEVMKMVSDLHEEADEDLKTKETCEADRMSNTKTAKKSAQSMDDETALINRKKADIEAMQKEIAGIVAHVKELKLQLEEAQIQRAKENREYKAAKADDEAAAVLIGKSKDVLEKFYADNGLALAQTGARSHKAKVAAAQPEVVAGEAPPPPPSTFGEPYGGNKGATNGIISLLEMVKTDVEKDIKTATAEEDKAKSEYDTFKTETETLIKSLESEKSNLEGEVGDAETAVVNAKKTRKDKKKVLDDTMAFLRSIAPSCDYMAVNFELRKANREAEIDGLIEAGASLQGGAFGKAGFLQKAEADDEC
jgi:DNA repair exonuclease SbcCD ATPase subunit